MATINFTSIDFLLKKNQPVKISGHSKEMLPIVNSEKAEIKEVVEHKAEEEVRPFVQPRSESIELPPDLKKLGLQASNSTKFPAYQNIKLPISDDKIIAGLHSPITSSIRWLATFAKYLLACSHLTLKTIHGKVVRVIRT